MGEKMIFNEELLHLEDQCAKLIAKIAQSKVMQDYQIAKREMESDPETQQKIRLFQEAKEQYERVEPYGSYASDYHELRKKVFQRKRAVDMAEQVYRFRTAERTLQVQLDLIAAELASAVSENILVSTGDPFSLSKIGLPKACETHLRERDANEL